MIASALATSRKADVCVYLDDDDVSQYDDTKGEFLGDPRVTFIIGPRIGGAQSLNEVVRQRLGYSAYGLGTDDGVFLTPGWDEFVLRTVGRYRKGIVAIAPFCIGLGRNDFPWVGAGWVDALGGLVHTDAKYFYWDIVIHILADQINAMVMAGESEFAMKHLSVLGSENEHDIKSASDKKTMAAFIDGRNTCFWLQEGRYKALIKLREAMV